MAATYEPIATTTIGSATSSYTFTSIPSTYTDLVLITNTKASSGDYLRFRVGNGSIDSGANYSQTVLSGNGSSAASYRYTSVNQSNLLIASAVPTSDYQLSIANFQNYSNTTTYKTIIHRGNNASSSVETGVTLWRSTSAINQIQVLFLSDNIAVGSTFTLYGIKAA